MRDFLDANVPFSAAYLERSRARAIFQLAATGLCELASSAYAIDEARRNIALKHPARLAELERLVGTLSICGEPGMAFATWATDLETSAKDAPIHGTRLRGVEVMRPAVALARLLDIADGRVP